MQLCSSPGVSGGFWPDNSYLIQRDVRERKESVREEKRKVEKKGRRKEEGKRKQKEGGERGTKEDGGAK